MAKSLRDIRQEEFADIFIKKGMFGILYLCPRFGKCRTAINVMKKTLPQRVLIVFPDRNIVGSWEEEFDICGYHPPDVTYTTYLSLPKYAQSPFDLVILDELHLMSEAQIISAQMMFRYNDNILGLTGTLTKETKKYIRRALGLDVLAEYPISLAIGEGVLVDYEIRVISVPLDTRILRTYGKKLKTEKKQFDDYTFVINKQLEEGKDVKFLRLNRMRIFQKSLSKLNKTRKLLEQRPDERILVFCGLTDISDKLGIPSYHSKSANKQSFEQFLNGEGNHMAVVKLGNTGKTYKPLNRVIINYFDSNAQNLTQKIMRCMSLEYNNPNKKAYIDIICTDEKVELNWLRQALSELEQSKITYL